jgi:hypothetical protein
VRALVMLAVASSGCLAAPPPTCGDLFCLADQMCRAGVCVPAGDVAACDHGAEGSPCIHAHVSSSNTTAVCEAGVCTDVVWTVNPLIGTRLDPTLAALVFPDGLAAGLNGDIYVADRGHHRVLRIVNNTTTVVAGNGTFGHTGDGGSRPRRSSRFRRVSPSTGSATSTSRTTRPPRSVASTRPGSSRGTRARVAPARWAATAVQR